MKSLRLYNPRSPAFAQNKRGELRHNKGSKTYKVMKRPKKIIVVDFGGVGDLILAIPFFRGLKSAFPSSELSVLCAKRAGMILKEQPYIDRLFLAPITILGLFKTGRQLRKKRFDMAINLMPSTSYFSAIKM